MRVQSQRSDAYPLTWELPLGVGLTFLGVTALVLPLGQALAFAATGHGFIWPHDLWASLNGLVAGDPGRALSPIQQSFLPEVALIYLVAGLLEMTLIVSVCIALRWWWTSAGPLAQFGLASRWEVSSTLGVGALRRRMRGIRPDLHLSRRDMTP